MGPRVAREEALLPAIACETRVGLAIGGQARHEDVVSLRVLAIPGRPIAHASRKNLPPTQRKVLALLEQGGDLGAAAEPSYCAASLALPTARPLSRPVDLPADYGERR